MKEPNSPTMMTQPSIMTTLNALAEMKFGRPCNDRIVDMVCREIVGCSNDGHNITLVMGFDKAVTTTHVMMNGGLNTVFDITDETRFIALIFDPTQEMVAMAGTYREIYHELETNHAPNDMGPVADATYQWLTGLANRKETDEK